MFNVSQFLAAAIGQSSQNIIMWPPLTAAEAGQWCLYCVQSWAQVYVGEKWHQDTEVGGAPLEGTLDNPYSTTGKGFI